MSYRICEARCDGVILTTMLVSFDTGYEVGMGCKLCVMVKNTLACSDEIADMVLVTTFARMAPPCRAAFDETAWSVCIIMGR